MRAWLFNMARWLVPEAQRFFVQRLGAHDRNQLSFDWLRSLIQPRVVAGLLVALAFWGALNFALRTTTNDSQLLLDNFAFQQGSEASPKGNVISVSKSSPARFCFSNWFNLNAGICTGSAAPEKTCKGVKVTNDISSSECWSARQKNVLNIVKFEHDTLPRSAGTRQHRGRLADRILARTAGEWLGCCVSAAAPTPMAGNVMYLPADRVRLLDITMAQARAIVKHIGIGSAEALRSAVLWLPAGAGA